MSTGLSSRSRPLLIGALLTTVCAGASAPLAAQASAQASGQSSTPVTDTTLRLSDGAVVDITVRTGRLLVRGVDGPGAIIRGAHDDYQVRSTGVGILLAPRDGEARSDRRRERDGREGRTIELDVPRGVRLVVNTLSADVDLRGVRGDVEFRTTSGDLIADGVGGRFFAETVTGDLDVVGSTTQTRIVTVSGDVQLRGPRGEVDVRTTSGNVQVAPAGAGQLSVRTMSGDVDVAVRMGEAARVDLSTHNGDVLVRLPAAARGRLEFSSVSGDLDTEAPLTLVPGEPPARRGRAARRFEFNGGGPLLVAITTFNGDLRVVRSDR